MRLTTKLFGTVAMLIVCESTAFADNRDLFQTIANGIVSCYGRNREVPAYFPVGNCSTDDLLNELEKNTIDITYSTARVATAFPFYTNLDATIDLGSEEGEYDIWTRSGNLRGTVSFEDQVTKAKCSFELDLEIGRTSCQGATFEFNCQ